MTHITVQTKELSYLGPLRLRVGSDDELRVGSRRWSKTPNLDGSVSITDGGMVPEDSDLTVTLPDLGEAEAAELVKMSAYAELILVTPYNVFEAAIRDYSFSGGSSRVVFGLTKTLR